MRTMNHEQQIYDQWLVVRCQSEEAAAFDELAERWQERLWRHALHLTGNTEAAWDILQETLLMISRKMMQLNDPAAFPAWAYRITSNLCLDWFRQEQRHRKGVQGYVEWLQQTEAPEFDTALRSDVRDAVASLADPDQTIIVLRYDEGFSVEEIAVILGVPVGTVKSRLHYVRKRLRLRMEESNHEQ
jgi:RNA polymerase sigma-70 factor, ECF subfamily